MENFTIPIPDFQQAYFDRKIEIKDEVILDSNGIADDIMMEWEREIMRDAAKLICQNGGDILNVGFGMGIIDTYIEEHRPRTHWIIEAHPDIQRKMMQEGWLKKPHVRCIFKPWQEVIQYLPKFDGIYFDTWDDHQDNFDRNVHNLLKEDGIFSFFNNPGQSTRYYEENDFYVLERHSDILTKNLNMNFQYQEIKTDIPEGLDYWSSNNKHYYHPICTRK
jgi:spermidine synthase